MIHEIGRELETRLRAVGCPFAVVDGPEATETVTFGRERVVIEHDGKDSFGPTRSQHVNPKVRRTRNIACKLTIYAQASASGARPFEHRRRAEHVLDMVLVGLDEVAAVRKNAWAPTGGGFITPDDLAKSESAGGAAYELQFTFERGVAMRSWIGDAQPDGTLGAMTSTTKVSRYGDSGTSPPIGAETACGS